MTVGELYDFHRAGLDDERWELIARRQPVLNASPAHCIA